MTRGRDSMTGLHGELKSQECREAYFIYLGLEETESYEAKLLRIAEDLTRQRERRSRRDISYLAFKLKPNSQISITPSIVNSLLRHLENNGLTPDDFLD